MLFFSLSPLLLYVGRFAAQVSKSSSILLLHVTIVTQTFGYLPLIQGKSLPNLDNHWICRKKILVHLGKDDYWTKMPHKKVMTFELVELTITGGADFPHLYSVTQKI